MVYAKIVMSIIQNRYQVCLLTSILTGLMYRYLSLMGMSEFQPPTELAEALAGKPKKVFLGLPGGKVFECAYARLPEGCGKTVHCVTCAIRNTVTSTIQKEVLQVRVPTKFHHEDK